MKIQFFLTSCLFFVTIGLTAQNTSELKIDGKSSKVDLNQIAGDSLNKSNMDIKGSGHDVRVRQMNSAHDTLITKTTTKGNNFLKSVTDDTNSILTVLAAFLAIVATVIGIRKQLGKKT